MRKSALPLIRYLLRQDTKAVHSDPIKEMQNTQILNQDGMSLKYNPEIKHVLTDAHCALHRFTSYKVSAGAKFVGESSLSNFCISSYS